MDGYHDAEQGGGGSDLFEKLSKRRKCSILESFLEEVEEKEKKRKRVKLANPAKLSSLRRPSYEESTPQKKKKKKQKIF